MAKGPRRGRGESPTEKLLRLEKSGASLVKVNVGRIAPDVPGEPGTAPDEPARTSTAADHEPDADRQ
jgi:hypothetical protein